MSFLDHIAQRRATLEDELHALTIADNFAKIPGDRPSMAVSLRRLWDMPMPVSDAVRIHLAKLADAFEMFG
jgi:hypothetical protein